MNSWRREGDRLVATLAQQEAALIRGMVDQIRDMLVGRAEEAPQDELAALTGIRTGPSLAPENPIMARLLPDFHRASMEDPDGELDAEYANSAAALRSLHEPAVLEAKTAATTVVMETCPVDGGEARLSEAEAESWVAALNDVRIALGTALDLTDDMPDELDPSDPRAPHYGVYQWLTWVQGSLVNELLFDDDPAYD
ncbi:DUF2017 domain-containing protein [Allokutzneria albata]|uniref:Uncharacterized protein n=1 Tax=Allokutzneria albata TaxID=211114 RepID=A0A1G9XXQ0_ALLAB|nr:DUF2017 domain-containing protein [Allokutzneria albata]SDN00955.1 protein of unknown function [Allokutzneria albata]